jgi:energy-coupling factor transporter ATP-binding protein EcfA2
VEEENHIELKNVYYHYPGTNKQLLRDINLEIKKNEITVIVGPVASGKSTLIRTINLLLEPDKGQVIINGKDAKDYHEKIYEMIGFLFQNPEDQLFYPVVVDDLAFGPRNLGLDRQEIHKRVIESSEQVGILHLLERETDSLSYGEKTLVALAGLLATRPSILLMDAPTTGLDLWSINRIIELLKKLKNTRTLVITTNTEEILKIADKIYFLWNGKIRGEYKSYRTFRSAMSRKNIV